MKDLIIEATDNVRKAMINHIEATRSEVRARDKVQKTRYALLKAKEALRYAEQDSIEDNVLQNIHA
jgi:hypothetical protein